jgi:hypothetical protein
MFVLRDHLMCQSGNTNPRHHSLTWTEITASDWCPIQAESGAEARPRSIDYTHANSILARTIPPETVSRIATVARGPLEMVERRVRDTHPRTGQ